MGVIKNKIIGIYGIYFNKELIYLGQSVNVYERWGSHKRELKNNKHHCQSFQEWFNENNININDLEFRVIESINDADKIKLYELELNYFNNLQPKYWTIKPNIGFAPVNLSKEALEEYNFKKSFKKNEAYKENFEKYNGIIYQLYVNEKKNMPIVAKELNIPYSLVRKICHELNVVRSHFQSLSNGDWASWQEEDIKVFLEGLINTYPTWPERAKVAGVSISSLRDRALKYNLFTPETVKTYKDVIKQFGEDYLKNFIKEKYIDGNENTGYMTQQLNCSLKSFFTLIDKLELRTNRTETIERINRKNSSHEYTKECFQCHEDFEAGSSQAKYCSPECIYKSKLIEHICKYCGEKYSNTSKNSKYCSRKCIYEDNSIAKECAKCHEDFKALRHNSKYCSPECGKQ